MNRIKQAPVPLGTLTVHRIVSVAGDIHDRLRRWRRVRRTARLLSTLDDHQLRDVGLSRSDIDRYLRDGHF